MENNSCENVEKEADRKMSNTEYTPTKCRITRPQPPKPATNPLQFIKVLPCDLSRRAQEQIKKVEEVKITREVVKEDAEDWQHNLDNWKSSRRKQQEHIIERVVEVKKMEQEEHDKGRRKTKTFNEMLEDKSRGRHKFNIPIYDDDSNDLSDYGIGSSSSKTNSIKDVDTDDNCSLLDEKEKDSFDVASHKDLCGSNQSQSEDEQRIAKSPSKPTSSVLNRRAERAALSPSSSMPRTPLPQTVLNSNTATELPEQYTYEGAIQDYRTRICSRINVDESIFQKQQDVSKCKEFSEAQNLLTKGNLLKRKEIFDKSVEISSYESTTARRLSDDFANSQSIKERLQCLEKCTDVPLRPTDKNEPIVSSVRSKVQSFTKQTEVVDTKNNNVGKRKPESPSANNNNKTIASYLLEKNTNTLEARNNQYRQQHNNGNAVANVNNNKDQERECFERPASPESEMFLNKLNEFNRDLDTIYGKSDHPHLAGDDFVTNANYPASTSSTELMALSSDREDSGIHTADVSCSVSQADEPFEDVEHLLPPTTHIVIPNCIEKLTKEKNQHEQTKKQLPKHPENTPELEEAHISPLQPERRNPVQNQEASLHSPLVEHIEETIKKDDIADELEPKTKPKQLPPAIYENVAITNANTLINNTSTQYSSEYFNMSSFSTSLQPPKMKPPPPPPIDTDEDDVRDEPTQPPPSPLKTTPVKRVSSTKRIKKELNIKRSSFLGLESPTDDHFDPDIGLEKPPDINTFLKKELRDKYKIPTLLYRDREYSEVESQDSGLDIDRGRLSSDTWCSSSTANNGHVHKRQDSEQTTSFTSEEPEEPEEDEIAKKEREIIALVEKEEKTHIGTDFAGYPSSDSSVQFENKMSPRPQTMYDSGLGSQKFDSPFCPQAQYEPIDTDQDSEVLKVEHELLQLEREELERQRENILFRENRAKRLQQQQQQYRLHNSYENICDIGGDSRAMSAAYSKEDLLRRSAGDQQSELLDYRKSMPELQHLPQDYRTSTCPLPSSIRSGGDNNSNMANENVPLSYYHANAQLDKPTTYLQQHKHNHRKSMPDIQHAYTRSMAEYCAATNRPMPTSHDHRKSMPELLDMNIPSVPMSLGISTNAGAQQGGLPSFAVPTDGSGKRLFNNNMAGSSSNSSSSCSSGLSNRVFLHHHQQHDRRDKERYMMHNPVESDAFVNTHHQQPRNPTSLNRHTLHALSAAPKSRPMDNWLHQQLPVTSKPVNQHWLCQEAELRRIADSNLHSQNQRISGINASYASAGGGVKHIPDAVIQTLTQRVANRGVGERVPTARNNNLLRSENTASNVIVPQRQKPTQQQLNGAATFGRALPMPNYVSSNGTANSVSLDDGLENKKLSVSGRKKCSYCGIELGRGAAMIIESLCLFYHMACFKCCVCCVPLGDGLIGTDVRVRNDKLHCHNCYSSDDGVKFSCV